MIDKYSLPPLSITVSTVHRGFLLQEITRTAARTRRADTMRRILRGVTPASPPWGSPPWHTPRHRSPQPLDYLTSPSSRLSHTPPSIAEYSPLSFNTDRSRPSVGNKNEAKHPLITPTLRSKKENKFWNSLMFSSWREGGKTEGDLIQCSPELVAPHRIC